MHSPSSALAALYPVSRLCFAQDNRTISLRLILHVDRRLPKEEIVSPYAGGNLLKK